MGKQRLYVSCKLENVTNLRLPADDDWYFILQCTNCGLNTENEVYFNPVEETEMEVRLVFIFTSFLKILKIFMNTQI